MSGKIQLVFTQLTNNLYEQNQDITTKSGVKIRVN